MTLRREVVSQDDHKLSYLVDGDGPVIIMLPAMLQSAIHWDRAGYIERFARTHRVLAIDLLGRGGSERPADEAAYAPEAIAAHVGDIMDHEEVQGAAVWGFAGGAEIGAIVARRRPQSVVAVVCGGMSLGDVDAGLRRQGIDIAVLTDRCASALDQGDWEAYFELAPLDVPAELRDEYISTNDAHVIAAITRADLMRHRIFLRPSVPTLAYWASGDVFAAENSRLAETMAIEHAVIKGAHTDSFLLAEQVGDHVEGFLATHLMA